MFIELTFFIFLEYWWSHKLGYFSALFHKTKNRNDIKSTILIKYFLLPLAGWSFYEALRLILVLTSAPLINSEWPLLLDRISITAIWNAHLYKLKKCNFLNLGSRGFMSSQEIICLLKFATKQELCVTMAEGPGSLE